VWSWFLASRVLCLLLLVPESGVLSDLEYFGRALGAEGLARALPEYPWPVVALLAAPLQAGITVGFPYFLALIAAFLAVDAAFAWQLWRAAGRRMSVGLGLWIALGPLLGPLVLTRFDALTAILAAGGIALAASRPALAGSFNALGCGIKLWPAIAFPALLVPGDARARLRAVAAATTTGLALAAATVLAAGAERLWSPFAFQAQRGLQVEAFAALPLLWARHVDAAFTWTTSLGACRCWEITGPGVDLVLQGAAGGLLVGLAALALLHARAFLAPPAARTIGLALRLMVVTLIVWIATNKVFSPQYLLWLAAPLALLGALPGEKLQHADTALFVAACLLTHLVFPLQYSSLTDPNPSKAWVLTTLSLRDLALIALGARLAHQAWRASARA